MGQTVAPQPSTCSTCVSTTVARSARSTSWCPASVSPGRSASLATRAVAAGPGHVLGLGLHERRHPAVIEPELQPNLDAGHDLAG